LARKPRSGAGAPASNLPPKQENTPADEPLRDEIESRLGPLIPAGKREQAVQIALSIYEESFSGPIAHPRHLAAYEQILPGAAERIVAMAEKQQDHNIAINEKMINAAIRDERFGMAAGVIVLLSFGAAAFVAGTVYNSPIVAGLFLAATVLDAVGMLLNRSRRQNGKP
jgi:uncharacterized membrane protein